jgi:hypothetical protein
MKTILPFRNDSDGFAFANTWTFDSTERAALSGLASPVIAGAVGAIAAVVPDPVLLGTLAGIATGALALGPLPTYGMCGGMAYSSADHWFAKAALPRGAGMNMQPLRTTSIGTSVRNMIWGRLLDSLSGGGALQRTLEWSLLLNQVPAAVGGGAGTLLNRTKTEWSIVKTTIDSGRVCPIGLVYGGRDVWDQHQILVYGYEDTNDGKATLFVYDSNNPHQYSDTQHDTVTLDFTGQKLVATSPSDFGTTLAGFFVTKYSQVAPPTGLAPSFGQFLSFSGDSHAWFCGYGARMRVASSTELATLGGNSAGVLATGASFNGKIATRPRDGALLREHSSAPVYLYQGGAPFFVPNPTVLGSFGGWAGVRVVPDFTIAAFASAPADDGTLLRELSAAKVYRMDGGKKRWVTTPNELSKYGGFGMVRLVPDGALASIPEGDVLPPPAPNECLTLASQVSGLSAEIARYETQLEIAADIHDQARIKAAIVRDQGLLSTLNARQAVLHCT